MTYLPMALADLIDFTVISAGLDTVMSLVEGVFEAIMTNPLLIVFVSTSMLGVGIGVFRRLKGAAR